MIVSANEDQTVSFYDIREKLQISQFVAHSSSVLTLDFRAKDNLLLTSGADCSVWLWDLRFCKCLSDVTILRKKYDDSILDVKFDPTGEFIFAACSDGSVKIFQY